MNKTIQTLSLLLMTIGTISAREYHVSTKGNDSNRGTELSPLRTISAAAIVAVAGDVITVHEGTYREWINPASGGTDDNQRITYRAAQGEKVYIKGSEEIRNWDKVDNGVWKVTIPNNFFVDYNPYQDLIAGDWFEGKGRIHHTGEVFLNGKSLYEKESLEKVMNPVAMTNVIDSVGSTYVWYCTSDDECTTIWANFHGANPNKELVEITTRPTCFYPTKPGINYLTISGFHISQAATQWGAPTAEQIGMVATHWNKGWIIENNTISDSKCSGITLGKERGTGHNVWLENQHKDGALHYIEVIFNTLRNGWSKNEIGSHIVRNNTIYNCEQTGMCGSMGAAFSRIENNHIYNIWTKRQFDGAEIAGIKFHAPINTILSHNRIHNTGRGIWLDWMAQGSRISGNILYDNDLHDIYLEVTHGPHTVDNNILASYNPLRLVSENGAFVHNLILGYTVPVPDFTRYTPYHLPNSTQIKGFSVTIAGSDHYYNNIFAPAYGTIEENSTNGRFGLQTYDKLPQPLNCSGNVYYGGAKESKNEKNFVYEPNHVASCKLEVVGDELFLHITMGNEIPTTEIVTTKTLGLATIVEVPFEDVDGGALVVDADFFGNKRSANSTPGPFHNLKSGTHRIKVW